MLTTALTAELICEVKAVAKWLNLHSIWIGQDDVEAWFLQAQCSNCLKWAHKMNPYTHEFEYKFCPSCGAQMLSDKDAGDKTVLYISVSFAVSYTGLLLPSF